MEKQSQLKGDQKEYMHVTQRFSLHPESTCLSLPDVLKYQLQNSCFSLYSFRFITPKEKRKHQRNPYTLRNFNGYKLATRKHEEIISLDF